MNNILDTRDYWSQHAAFESTARCDDMNAATSRRKPVITSLVFVLIGLLLVGGGSWLAGLGGSWYYLLAGLGFIA